MYRTARLGAHQSVAYTATAGTIANAVGAQTRHVRLVTTSAAFVAFGQNPTATASDAYVPADKPEYFTINPGEKASAVQVAAAGTLHVTELA